MSLSPDEILDELAWIRSYFPEGSIRAAQSCGSVLAPQLVAALEAACRSPRLPDEYVLPLCAVFLLAEWREPRAYSVLVDLCRLPAADLDSILGDVVTEALPQVLASVAGGDDSRLRELVADEKVSALARVAALRAMACGAVVGQLNRSRFASYMAALFRREVIPEEPHMLWDEAAVIVADLGLANLMPDVLRAFDDGLIEQSVILREELVQDLSLVREQFSPIGPARYAGISDALVELRRWRAMWKPKQRAQSSTWASEPHRRGVKVGRNDMCPCRSGKKFKKCCGRMGQAASEG